MPDPATGSRAYFGGPPWWVLFAVPLALMLGLGGLESLGMPKSPAFLVLFTVVLAGSGVAAAARRGWRAAVRTVVAPGAAALVVAAAVMATGLTFTGMGTPWSEGTYLSGAAAMAVVLLGVQYLLNRRPGIPGTTAPRSR